MKQKEIKRPLLKVFFTVLILSLLTAQVRYRSMSIDIFVSFLVFSIAVGFFTLKFPTQRERILIYFTTCILFFLIFLSWLLDGDFPLFGLPNTFSMILGCLVGFLFVYFKKNVTRVLTLVSGVAICMFLYFNHENWRHYVSFRNFSGEVKEREATTWSAYTLSGDTITARSFRNNIVLLDFWNTGCAVCFTKFPQVQKLYDKYRNDPKVSILSVNIPWEDDKPGIAFQAIEKKGYTFPVLAAAPGMDAAFQVHVYPTVIILDNGKPIFRGRLEEAAELLEQLTR